MEILDIAKEFNIIGTPVKYKPFGSGHINDTYLVTCDSGERYVLQRINHNVFKDVEGLMHNMVLVTEYIKEKSPNKCECVNIHRTKDGKPFYKCNDGYFKLYNYISNGVSIDSGANLKELYISAEGFGKFQQMLDGFDASKLIETIPNFHNTVSRYNDFLVAVEKDVANRADGVIDEINWMKARQKYTPAILDLLNKNEILYRVTHNDTKLNNVLIDVENERSVCVLDLDTVMSGAICYDFGDAIRTGANTGAEDEKDLSKVTFDISSYEAISKGFVKELRGKLLKKEVETLHFGAILMTYENALRFLTDYLSNDTYFKTDYNTHNLVRCRTQMKLVEGMEDVESEMQRIVLDCYYDKN